ncbi:hypothetical protein A0H81_07139 [Grifola frondosa]|uniref:Uncharacterized protein n=1 Tax=Grifola frondosa TaxID=5627 RepID=A0A1C7MAE8_GRIFR|nr:hypothetical protein A0H81_07139 [Grifola frondosa]
MSKTTMQMLIATNESVASCDAPPNLQNMPSISTRLHKRAREEDDVGEGDGAFEHGTSEQDDFADVSHAPRRNRIKRIRHDDDVPPATQPSPTPNKRVHRPLPQTPARGKGKGKAREDYDDADDVRSHYRHIPQPSVRNNGKGKAREVGSDDYSDADDERPRPRPVIQTPVRGNGKRKAHAVDFGDDDADDERPRRKYPRTPRYSAHEVAHNASVLPRLPALPRTPLHGERRRHSDAVPSYDPYVAPMSVSRPGPMLPPGRRSPPNSRAPAPKTYDGIRVRIRGYHLGPGSVPPLNPYLPPSSSQSSDAPFAGTSIWGLRDGVADHEDGGDARSSASDAQRPVLYRAPLLRGDRWHGHIPAEHGPERLLPSPPRPGGGDMKRGLEEPIDPRYDASLLLFISIISDLFSSSLVFFHSAVLYILVSPSWNVNSCQVSSKVAFL